MRASGRWRRRGSRRGSNQHTHEDASIEAPSQDDAAQRLNVSRSAVQRARVVLDNAEPEVVKLVEDGKLAVSAAAAVAKATPARQKRVAACIYPDPEKGGRGKKASATEGFPGVSYKMLSEARTVRALAPDLVAAVKAGETSLADAYKTAQDGKMAQGRQDGGVGRRGAERLMLI